MLFVPRISSLLRVRPHCYRAFSETGVSERLFERVCNETLDSLYDYIDSLAENDERSFDIVFANGVLSANFGTELGSFVFNRQLPNKQIWLSSPLSGPSRYDLHVRDNDRSPDQRHYSWIYKQTGQSLHRLLQSEFQQIFPTLPLDFSQCMHSH